MSTKRDEILDAVVAALAGTEGVETRIFRSRVEAFNRTEVPALIIEPVNDTPAEVSIGRLSWVLTFQISTIVRNDAPDEAAAPILGDIHQKIMTDDELADLTVDLKPGPVNWTFTDADMTQGVAVQQFRATYHTALTSVSA